MFLHRYEQRTRAVNAAVARAYKGEHLLFIVDSERDLRLFLLEFGDGNSTRIAFGAGSISFSAQPGEDAYDWAFWETNSGEYRIVSLPEVRHHHGRAGARCPSWEGCSYSEDPKAVYAQRARDREDAVYAAVYDSF